MRDLVDELLQAKVKARLFGGDHAPRLGRLILVDRIGAGAMGTVFAAYDPKLDRQVAVKVLEPGTAAERVLREARALGKLAHPNVVAIHDAGELDGAVYLVMELAPGVPLRTWLASERRPWRDVVRVVREAAAGIAAAHAAGLVHRDIKPDNILIGDRARVIDFGLAADPADATSAGTPSYMAPEVLAGGAATDASDQFSLGVTLYEALYGVRPYTGTTREELRAAALEASRNMRSRGSLRRERTDDTTARSDDASRPGAGRGRTDEVRTDATRARNAAVPGWVHSVVARMLAPEPAQRFASMTDVVSALGRQRRRTAIAAIAIPALLVGAGLGAVVYRAQSRPEPCGGGAARREAVWSPSIRERVRGELGRVAWTGKTLDDLDATAAHWEASFRRVCEATRVHGEQSDALLELRMRCLDRALERFGALANALGALDPEARSELATAAAELPDPAACETLADAAELAVPPDLATRTRLTAAERELDRAWAAYALGRYREAKTGIAELVRETDTIGVAALSAESALLAGMIDARTGDSAQARGELDRALADAARAHATAIELAVWPARLRLELFAGNPVHAIEWAPFAHAAAARAGLDGAELDGVIGEALRDAGQLAAARDRLTRARASHDPLRPDQRALIELNLGAIELAVGDVGAARAAFERGYALVHAMYGDGHPALALYLDKLAAADRASGKLATALARHDESLALRIAAFGDADRAVATALYYRGVTLLEAGQLAKATADLERARELRTKLYGATSPRLGEIEVALGDVAFAAGADAEARAHYAHAAVLDRRIEVAAKLVAAGARVVDAPSDAAHGPDDPVPLAALPSALEPWSVERAAALAIRVAHLPPVAARGLAAAMVGRWRATHEPAPALSLAIGDAALAAGDRTAAIAAYTAGLAALANEPSLTRLRLERGKARAMGAPAPAIPLPEVTR